MNEGMRFNIRLDVRFEQVDEQGRPINYSGTGGTSMSQSVIINVADFLGVCSVLAEFDKLMKELQK